MYVLFDTEINSYLEKPFRTPVTTWRGCKPYSRLAFALSPVSGAGLMNTNRNPPYTQRPQVEVHELDANGNILKVHQAPPSYIKIP